MSALNEFRHYILCLVADGLEDKEIARQLGISPYTVKDNMKIILSTLGARNRTQAVAIAFKVGLLEVA